MVGAEAQSVFKDTNIKITTDDQQHLGVVIGSESIKQKYIQEKNIPMDEQMVWHEPQAVYSAFIKGFIHKPIYFMRTIPNIKNQLKQLDDVIRTEFIPAITGAINCSDIERRLMSLPPSFGVLGIPIFSESAKKEYKFLTILSKDLATHN